MMNESSYYHYTKKIIQNELKKRSKLRVVLLALKFGVGKMCQKYKFAQIYIGIGCYPWMAAFSHQWQMSTISGKFN